MTEVSWLSWASTVSFRIDWFLTAVDPVFSYNSREQEFLTAHVNSWNHSYQIWCLGWFWHLFIFNAQSYQILFATRVSAMFQLLYGGNLLSPLATMVSSVLLITPSTSPVSRARLSIAWIDLLAPEPLHLIRPSIALNWRCWKITMKKCFISFELPTSLVKVSLHTYSRKVFRRSVPDEYSIQFKIQCSSNFDR